MVQQQLAFQRQQHQQQNVVNSQHMMMNQPKMKSYVSSNLPGLTDDFVADKLSEIKKITFSTEKRRVIQEICKNNSLTCHQAKLFTDLFRSSYEKVCAYHKFLIKI